MPEYLDDLQTRWEWHVNLYTEIDIGIMAHFLDATTRFKGLTEIRYHQNLSTIRSNPTRTDTVVIYRKLIM